MILPSEVGGAVASTVGYFHEKAAPLGEWLQRELGDSWVITYPGWGTWDEFKTALSPAASLDRYAFVPLGDWSLCFNNSRQGTDVGVLPSRAARSLAIRALRATCSEGLYPARVLEVFGPDGVPPLAHQRHVAAVIKFGEPAVRTRLR